MKPPNQHSRISLTELKAQIVKKLGPEGSKQYFHYLHRFLSLKVSKAEFDKLCLRILGRDNIPLHNHFIRSIVKNACSAKTPPPLSHKGDGYQANGSHTGLSNGVDMLPLSPRKARTSVRDRRGGDRLSAIRTNGKTSIAPPQLANATLSSDFSVILENKDMHHHQETAFHRPSKEKAELAFENDTKEGFDRSPLRAPIGVPFCPVSVGGACRALPSSSSNRCIGSYSDGALLDSFTLRERMEHIAVAEGLEGVSVDCATILNHGLDSYMKGLIRSCIELVGARTTNDTNKNHSQMKLINGLRVAMDLQEHRVVGPRSISLHDFRVAMELNPRHLGEDWPLLLEKICTHAFEE